ncbi:50S ribosomal protein L23 [Capnocytophaga sp. oral taxon 338 str. F0234]|nr:50S ribosomal protein L23 [Capnocytophaga sp. oral taxon 338 str. F0234]
MFVCVRKVKITSIEHFTKLRAKIQKLFYITIFLMIFSLKTKSLNIVKISSLLKKYL